MINVNVSDTITNYLGIVKVYHIGIDPHLVLDLSLDYFNLPNSATAKGPKDDPFVLHKK